MIELGNENSWSLNDFSTIPYKTQIDGVASENELLRIIIREDKLILCM